MIGTVIFTQYLNGSDVPFIVVFPRAAREPDSLSKKSLDAHDFKDV
jgi:hypothetical protein